MYEAIIQQQPRLVCIDDIQAPMPLFCGGEPLNAFNSLRRDVKDCVGYDFLGTLSDCFRTQNFKTSKYGVAFYSIHKTARAFDYEIPSNKYILVPEKRNGKTYFITWLKVETLPLARLQNMYSTGQTISRWLAGRLNNFILPKYKWFNFTQLAEYYKFERIPMWSSVNLSVKWSNALEFWHYQYMYENGVRLVWQSAMDLLRKPLDDNAIPLTSYTMLRFGDDGEDVTFLQKALVVKGYLRAEEVDGMFRKITLGAVMAFQKDNGLKADGIAGNATYAKLGI